MKRSAPNRSTPENDPTWYAGKPGPAPTGVKRSIQIPFMVDEEESEFTKRLARSADLTVNEMIRKLIFTRTWKTQLAHLRAIQGGRIAPRSKRAVKVA